MHDHKIMPLTFRRIGIPANHIGNNPESELKQKKNQPFIKL